MEITIVKNGVESKHNAHSKRFGDVLEEIGLNSEEFLGVRNGSLITEDETLKKGDVVKLLSVVSGG